MTIRPGMYSIALIGMGLQAIVSLAVGIRLLKLARRNRRFPELALSVKTLLLPGLGYPSMMVAAGLERMELPGVAPLAFVSVSIMMVAVSMNYFFTWRVFRPGGAWAVILCGLGVWLMFAPIGGAIDHIAASGIDRGMREAHVWLSLLLASVLTAYGWTSVESFLYFLKSRRRLRLGLMEADVCNRFLLWALASGAWLALAALSAFLVMLGVNPLSHGLFNLCLGATGLLDGVCMMLCFMPSERYLDWLRRRAAAVQGA